MNEKRVEARERATARQRDAAARGAAAAREATVLTEAAAEVIPWLRQLGIGAEQARRAAAACEAIPDAPLEERMRLALKSHGRGRATKIQPAPA